MIAAGVLLVVVIAALLIAIRATMPGDDD